MELTEWLNQTWIYIAALASGFAVLMNLSKNIKELKAEIKKPYEEQKKRIAALEEDVMSLNKISAQREDKLVAFANKELELEAKMDNFNDGMTALIRDKINSYYFDRCNDRGFITPTELEIVTALYDSYHKMGGNGLITREIEIINKFPVFETEEDYQKWMNRKSKKVEE